jgi:hypothetical protein
MVAFATTAGGPTGSVRYMSLPPEVVATDRALSRRKDPAPPDPGPPEITDWELRELEQRIREKQRAQRARYLAGERILTEWAKEYRKRDEMVRAAAERGLSTHRIHQITGIARTTIMRVLRDSTT